MINKKKKDKEKKEILYCLTKRISIFLNFYKVKRSIKFYTKLNLFVYIMYDQFLFLRISSFFLLGGWEFINFF